MPTLRDIGYCECHIDQDDFAAWCAIASTDLEYQMLYDLADSTVDSEVLLQYLAEHRPDIVRKIESAE